MRRELERFQRIDVQMLVDPTGELRPEPRDRTDGKELLQDTLPREGAAIEPLPIWSACTGCAPFGVAVGLASYASGAVRISDRQTSGLHPYDRPLASAQR